jgi:hypothetical protein
VHVASSSRTSACSWSTTSAKSCPAENTGPFAASTTPSASLPPTSVNAAIRSRMCSRDRAFRFAGLFMVMVAKSPLRSTRTWMYSMPQSHPAGGAAEGAAA